MVYNWLTDHTNDETLRIRTSVLALYHVRSRTKGQPGRNSIDPYGEKER